MTHKSLKAAKYYYIGLFNDFSTFSTTAYVIIKEMEPILMKKGMFWSITEKHSFALEIYLKYFYNIIRDRSDSYHRALSLGRLSSYLAFYTIVTLKPIVSVILNMRLFRWYSIYFIGGYYDYMWN